MLETHQNSRTYSRRSLYGQVAHSLGMRIVSGEIPEGEILSPEEIASADLSVSRTAYREAIKVLTAKGLVESRPKVGTRVRPRSDWNMLDPDVLLWASEFENTTDFADALFEFRLIIEPAAARLAAQKGIPAHIRDIRDAMATMASTAAVTKENVRADLAFHTAILLASGNELLSSLSYVAEALLVRSFEISQRHPDAREASIPLHQAVCDCISDGKADAAEQAMSTLLTSARADIDKVMRQEAKEHLGETLT